MVWKLITVTIMAVFSAILGGCIGNYQLVKVGLSANDTGKWIEFSPPREPLDRLEETVLKVALSTEKQTCGNWDVYFLVHDPYAEFIVVVEKNYQDNDRFAEKNVARYRVIDGKIAGKIEKTLEIFPDPEFERAVLTVALKAGGSDSVMQYEDPLHPVSLSAWRTDRCTTEVRVFDSFQTGGEPLATKVISGCFQVFADGKKPE